MHVYMHNEVHIYVSVDVYVCACICVYAHICSNNPRAATRARPPYPCYWVERVSAGLLKSCPGHQVTYLGHQLLYGYIILRTCVRAQLFPLFRSHAFVANSRVRCRVLDGFVRWRHHPVPQLGWCSPPAHDDAWQESSAATRQLQFHHPYRKSHGHTW